MEDPTLEEALDDPAVFARDVRDFQRAMSKYMIVTWFGIPVAMLAPLWNAVHSTGGSSIGVAVVVGLLLTAWVALGRIAVLVRRSLDLMDRVDDEILEARHAKRVLLVRRAERLERARERLAEIERRKVGEDHARRAVEVKRLLDGLG